MDINIQKVKPLLLSKTFWGIFIMLLAGLTPKAKLLNSDEMVLTANAAFEFIGAALAVYGRVVATAPISGVVQASPVVAVEGGTLAGIAATINGAGENIADVPLVAQDAIAEQAENVSEPQAFQGILSAVSAPKAASKPSMKTFFVLAAAASALDTVITVLSVGGGEKRTGLLKVLRAASAGLRDYMANPD
jgi:hypothetical protein